MEVIEAREPIRILANEAVDKASCFGTVVVTYLAEERDTVADLLAALLSAGFSVAENALSPETVLAYSYGERILPLLATCGCYLLVLSPRIKERRYWPLRNQIWYQVGYFSAHRTEELDTDEERRRLFSPVTFSDESFDLSRTPMQNQHADALWERGDGGRPRPSKQRIAAFVETLAASAPRLLRERFYGEGKGALDDMVEDRLQYRRLTFRLCVTEEDFSAACREMEGTGADGGEALCERLLRENIRHGARLLSFAKQESVELPLMPYAAEMAPVPADYPFPIEREDGSTVPKLVLERQYIPCYGRDGLHAECYFDLLLPFHTLFGVEFLPYLEVGTRMLVPHDVLLTLFRSNFREENAPRTEGGRLWFRLGLRGKRKDGTLADSEGDIIYPQ